MKEDINDLKKELEDIKEEHKTFKGEMLHEEIRRSKTWKIIAIIFMIISLSLFCQLIYLYNDIGVEEIVETTTTYEDIEVNQDGENNNYIGNDGDIVYGSKNQN